ncbi:DUF1905 domain-containing protein [Candidatus Galacturonibacter soehngenii]|uniref:DUF1905 domain-containing protein n=2 Tax=Candidatus Galacturonatibacter soehngenii TaxID=2307010 RepID=A0A7V7UCG3_9FIRM|nr:DUF1905 domain-containing protein [Candidatus Galacturonibacter soehngenii]
MNIEMHLPLVCYITSDLNHRKELHMAILFETNLAKVNERKIIKLPLAQSRQLPSRGMVMAKVIINKIDFLVPLEPDGKGSHWFELKDDLCNELKLVIGQTLTIQLESIDEWPEPEIPDDIMDTIKSAGLLSQWNNVTTKAKWDWLRWIRSTNNLSTRNKRIQVACSKLEKGDKRPCCFDRSRCTIMDVSKTGVLIE